MSPDMARVAEEAKRLALLWGRRWGARAARAALDFVFPPVCPLTDEAVSSSGRLAPAAWGKLTFLTDPQCARCGQPFELDPGEDMACAACLARPPVVASARAAAAYDETSRDLVLKLKHAARTDAVEMFAGWMALAGGEIVTAADRIVPVPLHASRLRLRRFNQSALLARALARRAGKVFDPDTLARRRATESQGGRSAVGRRRNVAGAFAVRPGRGELVEGARVLLVDDVRTTGATLDAAARALKAAGAARVDAVTLLRVVRPRDITL